MSKIQQFKEFILSSSDQIRKIQEKEKEMTKEILKEFFSEELNLINDILDMKTEWEDEGINFIFDLSIEHPTHMGKRIDLGIHREPDLVNILIGNFELHKFPELLDRWGKIRHGMWLFVEILKDNKHLSTEDHEILASCKKYIFERLKSGYPHFEIDDTFHQAIKISF
jgi:hypothetical protein